MMMGIFILLQIQSGGLKAKVPPFKIQFQTVTASSQDRSKTDIHMEIFQWKMKTEAAFMAL